MNNDRNKLDDRWDRWLGSAATDEQHKEAWRRWGMNMEPPMVPITPEWPANDALVAKTDIDSEKVSA